MINRGVAQTKVFLSGDDYAMFLMIVCKAATSYRAILHDYALMPNHYHLLMQTELDNLSGLMKQINSNYAIYFNKKYHRSGHLWQGRFISRYIKDESYLYALIRYIENNPVKAGLSQRAGEYPYTLVSSMMRGVGGVPKCAQNSMLIDQIGYAGIREWIDIQMDKEDYRVVEEIVRQKGIENEKGQRIPAYQKSLEQHFEKCSDRIERNKCIIDAVSDGYTQAEIARYLGLSRASVSIIMKNLTLNA